MKRDRPWLIAIGVLLILYLGIASAVFAFRHPWATETERFLHTWDAICFRHVPYDTMRPRGER